MRVMHLNLKNSKKEPWFGMVKQLIKREEYREIKPYWIERLQPIIDGIEPMPDLIIFSNGYAKNRPQFKIECQDLKIGTGVKMWGAVPGKEYYVFKLGELV